MAYEVIARKYRPQQFDEVVGQRHVTDTLKNAIEQDRVAHAYLFVGSRGIGKTTTARILAKALNCEKGPTATPCDKCESCRQIMAGNSLDVIEIDGASNRGIDRIRELRENVQYAPTRGPFKIYIIDEVHMLTTEAFNALLKTLEEPPSHVKFVFATTEPQKLLTTILSRCQRFDLRRISTTDIVNHLGKIAQSESIDISEDALLAVARGAEGGLRDAESALDQLIAFRGKTIEENDVLSVFGLVARASLEKMAAAVLQGDMHTIIDTIAELDRSGKDMQRVVIELIEYFKNLLVACYVGKDAENLDMTESQVEHFVETAKTTGAGRVMQVIEILTATESRLRYALSARTLLETELIRAGRAASTVSIEEIIQQVKALASAVGSESASPAVSAAQDQMDLKSPPHKKKALTPPETDSAPDDTDALNRLQSRWKELVEQIARIAPLARAFLVDACPLTVSADGVTIGVDEEFREDIPNMEAGRNRTAIQRVLSGELHRDVAISFEAVRREAVARPEEDEEEEYESDVDDESAHIVRERPTSYTESTSDAPPASLAAAQEWYKDETARRVCDFFDGSISDVRK